MSNRGGMQTAPLKSLYCKCGKETSKTIEYKDGTVISIHFTRKSTYWHVTCNGFTKRTFKKPNGWL